MIEIVPIDTPSLGERSYLPTDGEVAVEVGPQRNLDRVTAVAAARGVRVTHVVGTRIHNDYVTGGHALASEVGAAYLVNADDAVSFERTPVRDGTCSRPAPCGCGSSPRPATCAAAPPASRWPPERDRPRHTTRRGAPLSPAERSAAPVHPVGPAPPVEPGRGPRLLDARTA